MQRTHASIAAAITGSVEGKPSASTEQVRRRTAYPESSTALVRWVKQSAAHTQAMNSPAARTATAMSPAAHEGIESSNGRLQSALSDESSTAVSGHPASSLEQYALRSGESAEIRRNPVFKRVALVLTPINHDGSRSDVGNVVQTDYRRRESCWTHFQEAHRRLKSSSDFSGFQRHVFGEQQMQRTHASIAAAITASFISSAPAIATPGDPLGSVFPVAVEAGDEASTYGPAIARNASGQFVVAWAFFTFDASSNPSVAVLARRFDESATPLGDSFVVATSTSPSSFADRPRVAISPSGSFVVTWLDHPRYSVNDLGSSHAYLREYNSDGSPAGPAQLLDTDDSTLSDGAPSVAMDSSGDFVIAWARAHSDFRQYRPIGYGAHEIDIYKAQIATRRFAADGSPISNVEIAAERFSQYADLVKLYGGIFGPITGIFFNQLMRSDVDVAMDDNGDSVVVWGGEVYGSAYAGFFASAGAPIPGFTSIYARQFGADGKPKQKLPSLVDTNPVPLGGSGSVIFSNSPLQSPPRVAMTAGGAFVVAWEDSQARLGPRVHARRFSPAGLRLEPTIQEGIGIAPYDFPPPDSAPVAVASDQSGNFSLAWNNGSAIRSHAYSADGKPLNSAFDLSATDSSPSGDPALALTPTGPAVAVWPGFLNSAGAVFGVLFTPPH